MLSNKKLVFFFTAGVSLKKWSDGGMLSREVSLYNELAKHFDTIFFLSYGGKEEDEYKNRLAPNIEILHNNRRLNIFIYSFIAPFIHRKALKKADIYKTNQMLGSWTAIVAKLLFRKPLVVRQGYQYSLTLKKKGNFLWFFAASILEFLAYRVADEIIVTSQSIKDFIVEKYNIKAQKIMRIPNYVDTDVFKPFEIVKHEGRVLFVGRLDKEKNLFSLIEAVKGLDMELVLIGKGPLEVALKTKVKEEGLENVVFAGVIPNERLPGELNKATIFALPSIYEGNPKTLLEAMACGLPVIGTDVVGINEVIRHTENGYLCGISAEAIKEAILDVMSDEKISKRMGGNARREIVKNYSLKALAEKELGLMEELLKHKELIWSDDIESP